MPADLLHTPLEELCAEATSLRADGKGTTVTYSPKVFIPLTTLCRDVCHYCTFAKPPRRGERAYLSAGEVLEIARAGATAGCREALFTLGDKPERRYRVAREELAELGCETTIEYLARMCQLVLDETGLLPHANPGVMARDELALLREVSASQGIMLETVSDRLSERGGPHFGSPDKRPAARLETLGLAGELKIPFTTGILIGIGETREERLEALAAIGELQERYGHIQEVIVQNFRAKAGTKMAASTEPSLEELLWTAAAARLVLGPEMNIQVPPNLSYEEFPALLDAGINDWGGISPITIDHVNPEAPWPEVELVAQATGARGLELAPRLPLYPEYVADADAWCAPGVATAVRRSADATGLARDDRWSAGTAGSIPLWYGNTIANWTNSKINTANGNYNKLASSNGYYRNPHRSYSSVHKVFDPRVRAALARVENGDALDEDDVTALFEARGDSAAAVMRAADRLRREVCGDTVSYVVTRNINYTNVCYFRCGFCAFSKGKLAENLRGPAYVVPVDEIVRRSREAWERGAVEVCLQGGIHPAFTGHTYAEICEAVKMELPDLHVHAFSALEIWQGAATLGEPLERYLIRLRNVGLASLPGTAAEILDDEVRRVLCPDKVSTGQWLQVHDTAHRVGLRSTTTIMYGSVEAPRNAAPSPSRTPRPADPDGRVHGVRAASLRAHGGSHLPPGPRPARAHVPGGDPHALRRAARAAPAHHQRAGVLGEARRRGRPDRPRRGSQRPWRHPHERVDLPRCGRSARAGDAAGTDGGGDTRRRTDPAPADDALRNPGARAHTGLVRGPGPLGPAQSQGGHLGYAAPDAARPAGTRGGVAETN